MLPSLYHLAEEGKLYERTATIKILGGIRWIFAVAYPKIIFQCTIAEGCYRHRQCTSIAKH
ncbi:hypothetical protein SERLA73DRAFT_138109 [Serpula lacrymans var. lacrymans S7.3]|uniref:Uncharacterized protein n=2 Tax=Serpula lacrymans var. lacrymans TaxID=341189 RepID=F8Q0U6_SERL3|nr:uncharacterized protein SERLADRAFT_391580 [Serpula lacrymans var. lacrymans S7.9]EGN97924.1 hypothetical protein SERLA73DRAFT_138109 [Serpula lacrymans var. lacrymans S7.3]EGO23510.1 hypothetical protein SERLADRAFT_391580 [Serpula lacrymans var. lacrymans S7.9]